jgi:Holliday junction resolvase RusA-like endonuclease
MKPITFFVRGDIMGEPRTIPIAIPIPGKRGRGGHPLYRGTMLKPDHFDVHHTDPDQARWARANVWASSIGAVVQRLVLPLPLDIFFRVDEEWVFGRNGGHYGTGKNANTLKASAPYHCGTKPDRDNVDKLLLDTITRAGFWVDDARVCDGRIIKRYQRDASEPEGVYVRISRAAVGASIFDDTDILDLIPTSDQLFQEPAEGAAA